MKLIVSLSGLLLHFLLLHWTESVEEEKVNLTSLTKIIDFFKQNYTIKTAEGYSKPYAVAINVPKNQCNGSFDPSTFLTRENTTNVTDAIYNNSRFYKGNELIAVGPRSLNDCKINPVSELLTNGFEELLKRRNDSCVVFYSVCCIYINIEPALETLKNHSGIKAFVFSEVYGVDENVHQCSMHIKYCAQNCKEIVKYVPFYRCKQHCVKAM
ncbi:uncharacterized protein LOC125248704 [Megalobrama amblycephala]|uniref:uncharacterized protein LOC125248704 n=1 Tax=Megalobrama amblycephala TaxID=75352 RepID=UPI002013F096|nr:uncharacterized protein LOC125248704 [Megalobrama amblycephala]